MIKILAVFLLATSLTMPRAQAQISDVQPPPPEIVDPPPSAPETQSAPSAPQASEGSQTPEVSSDSTEEETRFSRIYQKYNQREISDQKWAEIAGNKASESYNLQQGDNLWDISTKLFGNGYYWPKVWSLNDDITNPHLVDQGKTLKFTPGSSTSAPSLGVDHADTNITETVNEEVVLSEPEFDTVVTQDSPGGNQVVIPPGRVSRPVLRHIPPSFREYNATFGNYDRKTGFAKDGLKKVKPKLVPGFVPSIAVEDVWDRDGKVIGIEGDETTASNYMNVFVKFHGPVQPGTRYTVFSTNGKITDPTTDYSIGVELETRAVLEVLELTDGGSENTYRARVVESVLPVRLNDSVRAGYLIVRTPFEMQGPISSVAARIINGESNKRYILGLYSVVYLDKGEEDGLHVGDLMPVLENIETRNPSTDIPFDPKPIGALKVVEVEKHVATAIIVEEHRDIRPGDMTQVSGEVKAGHTENSDDKEPDEQVIQENGG